MQPAMRTVTGRILLCVSLFLLVLMSIASAQAANASPDSSTGVRQSMEGLLTRLGGFQTSYDRSPTADYPNGVYTISGTGENISEISVRDIELIVVSLSGKNVVLDCDGGSPAAAGCVVSVPDEALGDDGILSPGEQFSVPVRIGLIDPLPFSFSYRVSGVVLEEEQEEPELPPLQLILETDREARSVVDETGGVVSAVASDGTVLALSVPAGALEDSTEIVLTPASSIPNLPFDGGLLAGVRLGPEGLSFNGFAALEVILPEPVSQLDAVGFGFQSDGSQFHLYPTEIDGNTVTFQVPHFSGVGIAAATPEEIQSLLSQHTPTTAEQQALQAIAAAASGSPEEFAEAARNALMQWYLAEVLPATTGAALSDSDLASAVDVFITWLRWVNLYANFEFPDETAAAEERLADGFIAAVDRANERCNADRDLDAAAAVLVWQQAASELGLDSGPLTTSAVLDNLCVQAAITEMTVTPDPLPANHPGELDLVASFSFADGEPVFDPPMNITFDAGSFGAVSPSTGTTDDTGHFTASVTLNGERIVVRNAQACISVLPVVCTSGDLNVPGAFALEAVGYLESETFEDGRSVVESAGGEVVVIEAVLAQGESFALSGQTVTFSLDGGGTLSDMEVETAFEGVASVEFTPPPGQTGVSTITASFTTLTGDLLTAEVIVEYSSRFQIVTDFPATVEPGTDVPLVVQVVELDATGNAAGVPGLQVELSATGGEVDDSVGVTDENGVFATFARLSPGSAGITVEITARDGEAGPVVATATVFATAAEPDPDVDVIGTWEGTATDSRFPQGTPRRVRITVSGAPDNLTVRFEIFIHPTLPTTSEYTGTLEGNALTATFTILPAGQVIEFTATVSGDTMTGRAEYSVPSCPEEGCFYEFEATRVS